jgi:hypothetical protein
MSVRLQAGAVLLPALTATAGLASAAPAGANGQGDPLFGDLDGDGVTDRAVLVADPVKARCGVVVQLGNGAGAYGPPRTYYYPEPGTSDIRYCPDMGVIVDLGGDGVSELVLAWFAGRPEGVEDLLVLEDFAPAAGFDAIFQPSDIGTENFNTDGLLDVYESTDQGSGLVTFLNTPTGQLVRGPLHHSHGGTSGYHFVDFDENGASDVAFYFTEGSDPGSPFFGVAVVLDDGTTTYLEPGPNSTEEQWDVLVSDYNVDGHQDVRTVSQAGVTRTFYGRGDGTFAPK